MNTFELAKKFLANQHYQVLEDDCSDRHIAFRYQMNTLHFWSNDEDEHFFFMTLHNFTEVTDENVSQVKENCYRINKDAKLVKLYILNDIIIAAAEVYYLAEADFNFQMANALKHLVAAKIMYKKLDD